MILLEIPLEKMGLATVLIEGVCAVDGCNFRHCDNSRYSSMYFYFVFDADVGNHFIGGMGYRQLREGVGELYTQTGDYVGTVRWL